MITHFISGPQPPQVVPKEKKGTDEKPKFVAGSKEHKEHIFKRTLELCEKDFEIGDMVHTKNHPRRGSGQIINIENDIRMVSWVGFKCKFIEVYWYDQNELDFYHPSELVKE